MNCSRAYANLKNSAGLVGVAQIPEWGFRRGFDTGIEQGCAERLAGNGVAESKPTTGITALALNAVPFQRRIRLREVPPFETPAGQLKPPVTGFRRHRLVPDIRDRSTSPTFALSADCRAIAPTVASCRSVGQVRLTVSRLAVGLLPAQCRDVEVVSDGPGKTLPLAILKPRPTSGGTGTTATSQCRPGRKWIEVSDARRAALRNLLAAVVVDKVDPEQRSQ